MEASHLFATMLCETSLQSGFPRHVMVWPLSHLYSHLLGRSLHLRLPTVRMRLGKTYMLGDSGGSGKVPFLKVRVFHPNALSYCNTSVPSLYRRHEAQKKREYGDRVREVEQASFTPLVFATTGGMGREAIVFYRRLADHLSRRGSTSYSQTLAFIRCTLSFSLLRSATMCIRGSRSISHRSSDASPEMGRIDEHRDF